MFCDCAGGMETYMDKKENDTTYIAMLIDVLKRKDKILQDLILETTKQKDLLLEEDFQLEAFEAILPQKDALIKMLENSDRGFGSLYTKVKAELHINKDKHKAEITQMQELIRQITDKSVQIRALEQNNKSRLEIYMSQKHKEFRDFRISSRTASSYYKNMPGKHTGESVFLDKKK